MTAPALQLLGSPTSHPPLPTLWDGDPIQWEPWTKRITVTHIDRSCDGCGLDSSLWQATGFYTRSKLGGQWSEWKRRGMRNFHATRCGWCGYTDVYTMHDQQSWILDDSDYGPDGSHHPAALAGAHTEGHDHDV